MLLLPSVMIFFGSLNQGILIPCDTKAFADESDDAAENAIENMDLCPQNDLEFGQA